MLEKFKNLIFGRKTVFDATKIIWKISKKYEYLWEFWTQLNKFSIKWKLMMRPGKNCKKGPNVEVSHNKLKFCTYVLYGPTNGKQKSWPTYLLSIFCNSIFFFEGGDKIFKIEFGIDYYRFGPKKSNGVVRFSNFEIFKEL